MSGPRDWRATVLPIVLSLLMVVSVAVVPAAANGVALPTERSVQGGNPTADIEASGASASSARTDRTRELASSGNATDGTIASCTTIDTNGTYRLTQNITAPNDATCIFINASDVTFDGNGYTLTANGSGTSAGHPIAVQDSPEFPDFVEGTLSNVTVRNVRTVGWFKPVYFRDVENGSIVDVVVRDTTVAGVQFVGGSNHRVVDTTVTGSAQGVEVRDAPGVRIVRTITTDNLDQGILLVTAPNATVRDSTARGNDAGIHSISRSDHLTVVNSTVEANRKDGIVVAGATNGRVVNNTVRGSGFFGIHVVGGQDHTVADNTVTLNRDGIRIDRSLRTIVKNNSVQQNIRRGVYVWNADESVVRDNTVVGNETAPHPTFQTGIEIQSSANATVEHNVIAHHTDAGLRAFQAAISLQIAENVIRDNGRGVELANGLTSGTIERNRIVDNTDAGIFASFDAEAQLVAIRQNVIAGNDDGARVDYRHDDLVLDVASNWWGAASGPSSPGGVATNLTDPVTGAVANGTGDTVSQNGSNPGVSNIHFDPWLASEPVIPFGRDRPLITTSRFPHSRVWEFTSTRLEVAGGTPPFTAFTIVNGTLPPGMTLYDDGVVNGTPTQAGNYTFTVQVTDSDNATANRTFVKRVTVSVPPQELDIEKAGTTPIPGRTQLYLIQVTNRGPSVVRNISVQEYVMPWFAYLEATPRPNNVSTIVLFEGSSYGWDGDLNLTTLTWEIAELAPGESTLISYQARLNSSVPVGFPVSGKACSCSGSCCGEYKKCKQDVGQGCAAPDMLGGPGTASACASLQVISCGLSLFGPSPGDICNELGDKAICSRTYQACRAADGQSPRVPPCDEDRENATGAVDPNVKLVVQDRYIRPDETLLYAIHFENIGDAPATNVTVTDRLSPALNLSTVEVFTTNRTRLPLNASEPATLLRQNRTRQLNVTIGNQTVTRNETVVEHHTAILDDRTVRWHLENIDLAPNASGTVLLSVAPDEGLPNGTRIENNATIEFDEVSRLTTNDTVNVIDGVAPTCRVSSLPARSPRDITLGWTGSDPVGEIDEVTIFVSSDGETWEIATSGLDNDTVTFRGELGATYQFMCLAEDGAGNREVQPPAAEATTTVAAVTVSGTVHEADGDPAANDTVTLADAAQSTLRATVFDQSRAVVCGLVLTDLARTDRTGRFSIASEVTVEKDLAYYQAHPAFFSGANGPPPIGSTPFPRDGSPDLFGLERFTPTADTDVGTVDLPPAHVVGLTVLAEDGTPVENASVAVEHTGADGARAMVVFPNATNASGVFVPEGADEPGLELTGDITVYVAPPSNDSRFVDVVTSRNLTVGSSRAVTLELATTGNEPPAVDAGPDADLDEGDTFNRTGSISDPDSTSWTGTVDYGDGTGTNPLAVSGSTFDLDHRYVENGSYTVTINVSDGVDTGTDRVNVTVRNVPPTVTTSGDTIEEGSNATVNATFTDPGVVDTHTATINWSDGGTEAVAVQQGPGSGSLSADRRYLDDGAHHATVTVTDDDGASGTDTAAITVQNVAPTLSVAMDDPVDEGAPLTLTATITDPGVADTHTVTVDWGDGNASTLTVDQPAETFTSTVQHTFADDGDYDVNVTVRDDDGGEAAVTATATVRNVPPVVTATGTTIAEGELATIEASFTDPGLADTHTATVNWSYGPTTSASVAQRAGGGSLSASHRYGDDGAYTVVVTVTDDDGGVGTATVVVATRNLAPTVSLNTSGMVTLAGSNVFLGVAGQSQQHTANATDPGSDDLTVSWTPGPTTTYYNDGTDPDLKPSPTGNYPFVVADTAAVTFGTPGVYDLAVSVTDDDGATATVNATKVVTGDAGEARSMGFWRHQYSGRGHPHHSRENLTAFLTVTDVGSAVFGEEVPLGSFDAAHDALDPSGPSMRDKAEAQALAAWLNFASGRVGWTERIDVDGDGVGDRAFHDVIGEVESILQDGDASRRQLELAKDLAEAVNTRGEGMTEDDGDEAEDEEDDDDEADEAEHEEADDDEEDGEGPPGREARDEEDEDE